MDHRQVALQLERAIEIAIAAHRGVLDKAGKPYILHPLSLMLRFRDLDAMITAVLHDTVEDSALTLDMLRAEGFSDAVVGAVNALTRRENESYDEFISRLSSDSIGRQVKLADLEHNMDLRRLSTLDAMDLERVEKYHRAWVQLDRGNKATISSICPSG
jgi:(p)ppGpp synthase/HD superfamily hydrolase